MVKKSQKLFNVLYERPLMSRLLLPSAPDRIPTGEIDKMCMHFPCYSTFSVGILSEKQMSSGEFLKNLEFWYFRLGYVFEQKMSDEEPNIRWMASMPKWCFPKKLITLGLLMKHNDTLRYGNEYALQDLKNCTKYYHGQSLTGKLFYWL